MTHAPNVKAAALARLVAGESPKRVGRALGLPYSTVKRWQGEAFDACGNGHRKKGGAGGDPLGALVVDALGESLESARVLAARLGDPAHLDTLDARQIAAIHGGMFDRAFRLLGGLGKG